VKRSITYVENHLALLTSGDELIALVKKKKMLPPLPPLGWFVSMVRQREKY